MAKLSRKEREISEKRTQRRDMIMYSAMELFDQKGFHNVSLLEIAKSVELSKAAIYRYFTSKEDLLFSILLEYFKSSWVYLTEKVGLTGYQQLETIVAGAKSSYSENLTMKHLIMNFDHLFIDGYPELESAKEYGRLIERSLEEVEEVVRRGVVDGSLRADLEPRRISCTLGNIISTFGGTTAVRRNLLTIEQGVDPYDEYSDLLDCILAGIKA